MAFPLNLLISLPCAEVPLSEWGLPKIFANQPTKTQRTQRELKTCLYFTANWGFSLWSGSVQPRVLKARWFSINTDFQGQLCRILSLKLSIHPHPLPHHYHSPYHTGKWEVKLTWIPRLLWSVCAHRHQWQLAFGPSHSEHILSPPHLETCDKSWDNGQWQKN